jgi:hypothetical protein|tara:strand:+ start:28 stop:174 length:147 start_codon:yes stop_codon:yes gene_type:complete
MIKKIISLVLLVGLSACASVKDKVPKLERKNCTGQMTTLADVFCKKEK